MERIVITTLCISLSVILTPCASKQIQVQSTHEGQDLRVSVLTLPRKLRLIEEAAPVKVNGGKELSSYNKLKRSLSGKKHHEEAAGIVHARAGTRQEWVEGTDESTQFFTMDYSHVRRRRPIHNKSVPVGP